MGLMPQASGLRVGTLRLRPLDQLLPPTPGSRSAALWGLGGSGKIQIALDYAYRRCDADDDCCVFWVHADNEATFLADYKTISKKLGVDARLDGSDLLDAIIILGNADDLRLFGVGQQAKAEEMSEHQNQNLHKYVPCTSQGTVLRTSRDAHILGPLVGSRRGIKVRSMAMNEATTLLARTRDEPSTAEEALGETGVDAQLEELQRLPLAISQAGAYMRRMSMTAEQYLSLLRQGKTRWEVLKVTDADRRRRLELVAEAACRYDEDDKDSTRQALELKVLEAVAQLKEFSFLSLYETEDSSRRYEMHKLMQEAIRYRLRDKEFYSGRALQARCERYLIYAIRVGEWAEVGETETETANLLQRKEKEPVDSRAWGLRREVLGEKYPDTISSMADLAAMYHAQGRYDEAEGIYQQVLKVRQKVPEEKHPDTISSMASLATTYHQQGRYAEAEQLHQTALDLRRLTQVGNSKGREKLGQGSLWETIRRKADNFCKLRFSRTQGPR
ncbi:Tetratricopeptide repeat-domain-containing protein [Ilyonectria robusta]|uniref:Tetratricopeptide repeat-domain-containing protein n=1 Tax=Ilyonectria robusta TaxID=1079257 RepID=UPI001E8CAC3E|nr:Tetratricopeptide repeat-domain-containing protein [Ilyonectria robusta]KAH8686304.1 Tetratricopeptide repeat-domain-containing protein [Ilyonectria robusta]